MSGQHAAFSPSSAHRVVTCPASFLLSKDAPRVPNWHAVEGSIGHAIHEHMLLNNTPAKYFVGKRPQEFMEVAQLDPEEWALVPADWVADETFVAHVERSVDWCLSYDGERHIEQRVDISRYTPIPGQFGSCDFACVMRNGKLVIIDLKMGTGVKVYAERNHQLALYALGFMEKFDWLYAFNDVDVCVSQPRLDHFDRWETTADELRAFGEEMKGRFTIALQPDAPFGPDEKACKFCPVKATCPALAQRAQELALGMFDVLGDEMAAPALRDDWPISAPDARALTAEQISAVLKNRELIEGFLEAVQAQATHMLLHGQPVPDYKLVEGRSARVIKDRDGYAAYLKQHGVEPYKPAEVITLGDAEKALKTKEKKAGLAAFTDKPKGKPTLAPASDKREAYTVTSDQMFDDLAQSNPVQE